VDRLLQALTALAALVPASGLLGQVVDRPTTEPLPIEAGLAPPPGPYAPGLDAERYDFEISLFEGQTWFAGNAEVTLRLTDPRPDEIALDLTGLHVDRVLVDGVRSTFRLEGGKIVLPTPPSAANEVVAVRISYRGVPDDGLIIGRTRYGAPAVFADNWPNRARFWIPTIDHPSDKATVRFTVHAPGAWTVVAPGTLVDGPTPTAADALGGAGGRQSWTWETNTPISPYNMVIGATEFAVQRVGLGACRNAPASPREDRCVEVTSWAYPQDADAAAAKFRRSADMVEAFAWMLGVFAYEKLAHVQALTRFGGMENASAIFYGEDGVANDPDDGVVSHETAHMWFGGAVTEAEWSHLWLSEGFASYFGAAYFEDAVSVADFRRRMEESRLRYVGSDDVDKPVIRREDNLFDLLNRNNYQKGAWVLHMLRAQVGEQAFREGIRAYYNRFRDSTVLTEDFQSVMEEVSGRDLSWFFDQWLYRPGYPQLRLQTAWDEERSEVVLTVEQMQPAEWPTFRFDAVVELRHATGAARRPIQITKRLHTFRLPLAVEPTAVVLDPDGWILKTVRGR
jgi:aminopeptidase N